MWWQSEGRQNPHGAYQRLSALAAACCASRFGGDDEVVKQGIATLELAAQELQETWYALIQRGLARPLWR